MRISRDIFMHIYELEFRSIPAPLSHKNLRHCNINKAIKKVVYYRTKSIRLFAVIKLYTHFTVMISAVQKFDSQNFNNDDLLSARRSLAQSSDCDDLVQAQIDSIAVQTAER